MPVYRIFRMKDAPRQSFRWAPHVSGLTVVKPRDYQESGTLEAISPYAAWAELNGSGQPLAVGDVLELPSGELRICKYVGWEQAQWAETAAASGARDVATARLFEPAPEH